MPRTAQFALDPRPSRRHNCVLLKPLVDLPILTRVGDKVSYPSLRFIFDTGADICVVPLPFARSHKIPFEDSAGYADDPPQTRGGPLKGYWGTLTILFLDQNVDLPCFFYEPAEPPQADGPTANRQSRPSLKTDESLQALIRHLKQQHGEEEPKEVHALPVLGRMRFLDHYNVLIQDGHLMISACRFQPPTSWSRALWDLLSRWLPGLRRPVV